MRYLNSISPLIGFSEKDISVLFRFSRLRRLFGTVIAVPPDHVLFAALALGIRANLDQYST